MLQNRYYLYQRTFQIHEYGVWLERRMKRLFVIAVVRATSGPEYEDGLMQPRFQDNITLYHSIKVALDARM